MRISILFLIVFLVSFSVKAQWTQRSVNYRYSKHPDFYIPLAMHFSDSSNGFIVNNSALMQYREGFWHPANQNIFDEFTYTNVFTVNPTNTFLCSYDGKIAKYNGDSLSVIFALEPTEEPTPAFNTIFMTDSTSGWAAGDAGILIKIDGDTFTRDSISNLFNFRDIYFDSPGHGWMIGVEETEEGNSGVVCEYSNGHWAVQSYLDVFLYDIEFSSPGHGFISGQNGIYRFSSNDQTWEQEHIEGYYPQYHLSLLNDTYGISVSDNSRNMIFENGIWTDGPAADVTDLINVQTTDYGQAWAISQIGNNNPENFNEGKLQRMEENTWSNYSLNYLDSVLILPVNYALTNLAGTGRKNIWLNGQYLNIPANQNWYDTIPTLASDTFCTVGKIFSNNFGLGTNGDLQEWNGQSWINKHLDSSNPDTSYINLSMYVFDDTTAFICRQFLVWETGEFKSAVSAYNYSSNSLLNTSILDTRSTFGIHFSDKRNGWCVGDDGLIAKYSNNSWQIIPGITGNRLNGVFTLDSANAWIVGDHGTVLKYDGNSWSRQSLPTEQSLHSVYFTDSMNGWITGDSGLIFKYNGASWEKDSTINTTNALYSVYMVDSTYGFVGGDNGTLLQYIKQQDTIPPPATNQICENGSAFFAYNPSGNNFTYQWQIDTGNGFENLADDTVYSGALSDTLRIAVLYPGFYGYRYRCIASMEGVDSISNVEKLIYVNRWAGTADSAWENPANWSCGTLPGPGTDVEISDGSVVLGSVVAIRSLKVLPGANITIAEGGGLEILK